MHDHTNPTSSRRTFLRGTATTAAVALGAASALTACSSLGMAVDDDALAVGFSYAKPPYVFAAPPFKARDYNVTREGLGIEIDLVRAVLEPLGHELRPVYMSYDELNPALAAGELDAAVTVRPEVNTAHYTSVFDAYQNYAITRFDPKDRLDGVEDLAGQRIIAWEGARLDLGKDFARVTAQAASYREVGNQHDQVEAFLEGEADVLIIDGRIFRYWAEGAGYERASFSFHDVLDPSTSFRVGFASKELRDAFDDGMKKLRADGTYDQIVASYTNAEN